MNEFLFIYKHQIVHTIITLFILLSLHLVTTKFIRRLGKRENIHNARTVLIIKYVNITIITIALSVLSIVWGVNFKNLGIIFSSVFAVLGVALFAQWSILSNITAGVILFFSFPFKIGDRIKIQDKDYPSEAVIEDIKAFHVYLRTDEGELLIYPNSLMLQKGVVVISLSHAEGDDQVSDS